MKLQKEKLIEKYNIAFGIFLVSILVILGYNFLSLDLFHFKQIDEITKIYYADNITTAHQKVIDLFNEQNKGNIEIVPINLPFTKFTTNERKELLARSLRTDNSIVDIFAVDLIWISRFSKWAEPLDSYFTGDELERILPDLLETSYYDGDLVSIPMYMDIGVLFYRNDLLEKKVEDWENVEKRLTHSISWKELINISHKYFPDQFTYSFQGKAFEGLVCNYGEILESMGGELSFDDSTRITGEINIEATEFMHNLIHKYKVSPPELSKYSEVSSYNYMRENELPFLRGWFSSSKDSISFGGDPNYYKTLSMGMLPRFGDKPFKTARGGWNLMIKKNSTKKEASIKFIKFILSNPIQELLYKEARFLFVTNEMYDKKEVLGELSKLDLRDIIENHSFNRPVSENYTKISDIYSYYVNQALEGKIGSDVAMQKIVKTVFSDQVFIK